MPGTETRAGRYPQPVARLLSLGQPELNSIGDPEQWLDYREMGLGPEHIPDLIRLAIDREIYLDSSNALEVWGPIHAWRALGQLRAVEAIEPLIGIMRTWEGDEWVTDELAQVLPLIGPEVVPAIIAFLLDPGMSDEARGKVLPSLVATCRAYPEERERCIDAVRQLLERHEANTPGLNGFLVSAALDLKAAELVPLIRQVYEAGNIDVWIARWDDVVEQFGLDADNWPPLPERGEDEVSGLLHRIASLIVSGAAPEIEEPEPSEQPPARPAGRPSSGPATEKKAAKARRKQAKKSRKRNR